MTLATTCALAACGDDVTSPDGLIDSAEAEAVLRSADALPLLPSYLESADSVGERARLTLVRARELWDAGTAVDDARGAAWRRRAIGYALPMLVETVPSNGWGEARESLANWIATATEMLSQLSMPDVEARIEAAMRELVRADRATTDRTRAYHLLLAGSELVETTPRFVARSMARDADAAVRRARGKSEGAARAGFPEATLERAERLKDWSARAVETGDYLLAIQRAYYAIQLVEGS